MIMKRIPFSLNDSYLIGEFIYSYTKDVLIKTDAINLVKVLFRNELLFNINSWLRDIEKQDQKVATKLINLLENNVSKEQHIEIMRAYYELSI